MKGAEKIREPVIAAGGIVVRDASRPTLAIVQLRKDRSWVLPKGKLKPGEDALAGARREVMEETGHDVSVHEFLGAMSHDNGGRMKVVQFWHMQTTGGPVRELTDDVRSVKWLPLKQAIDALSRPHEKVFLASVGPAALKAARQSVATETAGPVDRPSRDEALAPARATLADTIRTWLRRVTRPVADSLR
jgi:8-oxo-dGTP diphosphatase